MAAASEPELRQAVHKCIAAEAELASCCSALQQTRHGSSAAAVASELAKGGGDLSAAATRLLGAGLKALEAAVAPLEKVAGGAPDGAVWWKGKEKSVHIMTHFSKSLDTIDPAPIESNMGAVQQATRARVLLMLSHKRVPARSDLRLRLPAFAARQAMQKFREDVAFFKENTSVKAGAQGADAKLETASKLWQRARLTKLEFQAGRVLLRSKKKKGKLVELQTQFIQETGRDPKAEVHGPLYEQWAAACSKP